ncbi:geranylgeranyl diphosphate synthase [Moniliophthora roreri MCA 2997]|uniref:(2E,6E)-farnesyl diphosphate synthase n=1 Tax=Moniliophthora roreri (strain MCA 2997) TaxID=1381753 RepID=V2WND9_MONRO|nr:geranylgeranyl diphosphate synthase [Moniliophthora roreri MCA 2997]
MAQIDNVQQELPASGSKVYDTLLERLSSEWEWTQQNESSILEPYTYITSNPGKDIRSRFIDAFNSWLNVPQEKAKIIAGIVNMLHSASLLIDDIQDNSQLRRGHPVAHKIYGVPQTINTANYVYFLAFQEISKLPKGSAYPDVDAFITAELLSLHRGQGLDLFWRDSLQCPTEEEYVGMVNNKTGGLLRIGIKLMMVMATTNVGVDYVPLVNLIGVYFQIRDDLMNLSSADYATNKGFAEDLTEGKFSFPIVHGIRKDTDNRQILNVLQKRPSSPTLKLHTVNYLRDSTQSFQYTLGVLVNLESQIRAEIARLGGNKSLEQLIDYLHVDPTTM